MASVGSLSQDVQVVFQMVVPGANLSDEHMAKIIKWCVNAFKKEYPLLFTREYSCGRKPEYEWDELLAFEIYSVYSNKRSLRKRVEWLSNNDESCNYILNNKRPCKTTLNDFRLNHSILIVEFFYFTIDLGLELGLIEGETVTLDSTKVKAYANSFRTLSVVQLNYLLDLIYDFSFNCSKNSKWFKLRKYFFKDKLPEDLVDLVDEIYDNLNVHGINLLKTALQSMDKRDWVIGLLDDFLDKADSKKRVNLTDPESRKMQMKDDTSRYGYTLQSARDINTGFIVSQRITQEKNDKGTLIPAIDDIKMTLGKSPHYILIDNGYWDIKSIEYAYMNNIIPIIPDINQSKKNNGRNKDNPFAKHNLKFNPVKECYICPYGQNLNYSIEKINEEYKRVFTTDTCQECPFHDECAKNNKYRKFKESAHPLVLETRKNYLASVELFLYQYRGIYSEGGFGTLKHAREYLDLRRRGIKKADIDLKLEAIVDNLIKIQKHFQGTLINLN